MSDEFTAISGTSVLLDTLSIDKARDLAHLLNEDAIQYANFVECRTRDEIEIVIFDVEVELGQLLHHAIEHQERIAAVFYPSDDRMPETFALRKDFPEVPHLNIYDQEYPKSLCLYDVPYSELKRQWTAPRYVERLRMWLAQTAKGTLHGDDQPLEPLLTGFVGHIVLPSDLLSQDDNSGRPLSVALIDDKPNRLFLITGYDQKLLKQLKPQLVTITLKCKPQIHGLMRYAPRNLDTLAALTSNAGLDLYAGLRKHIAELKDRTQENSNEEKSLLDSHLNLIVILPKLRKHDSKVEAKEVCAFITANNVKEIGISIGLWTEIDGKLGRQLIPSPDQNGKNIAVDFLNPILTMTRKSAQEFNDVTDLGLDSSITCIGAGALGSQLIINLARMGYGKWSIIDDDYLFPHNLARHILPNSCVGFPKATTVAGFANSLTDDDDVFESIVANVLQAGDNQKETTVALESSDVILDTSASVSVARYLASDLNSKSRRVSVFLNPSGSDLVVLCEDDERTIPLDCLEMQYYRALIRNDQLRDHLMHKDGRLRYGQSCRDLTSRIPQDQVALHSAIASRAIRSVLAGSNASITIWRAMEDLCVNKVQIQTAGVIRQQIGDWCVYCDSEFLSDLHRYRRTRLPNETGGVIVGSLDMERKIVYMVEVIPSPEDSDEWPTLYVRGIRGLKSKIDRIATCTDGVLQYVGEWHSHPRQCSTAPSLDDITVFTWLTEHMGTDGLPAVMMIVGDVGRVSCFVGTIERKENLIPVESHGFQY